MTIRMRDALVGHLGELRFEPTAKRVRASLDGEVVADTTAARLVWEPRRVVPSYAVPRTDLRGALAQVSDEPGPVADEAVGLRLPDVTDLPILDPSIPFAVHTTEGVAVEVGRADGTARGAGFVPDDPALADLVVLDFDDFDWLEEEEHIVSHPRDPFHRIDVLASSRHVRLELDGLVLAESTRPHLLFETSLPMRFYLPHEDVQADLQPSPTRTWCAYKGEASYWSVDAGSELVADLAWEYPSPRHDAAAVRGMVSFFDERVDVVLDGERRPRPVTPWS